jgi:organic radical activating enzyme
VTKGYLSEIFASFQGEGLHAGRRHVFLRLSGCHLRCRYCDTPGSLERTAVCVIRTPDGQTIAENPLAADEVAAYALPLLEQAGVVDGVAITGGEPLLQATFLADLLADPRWPRPRLLETSGTLPDKLETVLPVVDVVSMDLKLPSNSGETPWWDAHEQFLRTARPKAYVKVLVDEGTAISEVVRAARLVRRVSPDCAVFLQPITLDSGRVDIRPNTLDRFFRAAREELANVRVLPQTHKMMGIA